MRFAAGVEYDGRGFLGWQRQEDGNTIQACVETALSRVADAPVAAVCAGRTDAGVHAVGQVVHFETSAIRTERAWALGANSYLPPQISIIWVRPVPDDFHARYRALWRQYRYVILNRTMRPGLLKGRVAWRPRPLDADSMALAAAHLLGRHDFSSFRALACQSKSPVRTVLGIEVARQGDFVQLDVRADGFLHHMVRNIAGALIAVGEGERESAWLSDLLACRDRAQCAMTAPADGLYFVHAHYDAVYNLPPMAALPRFA